LAALPRVLMVFTGGTISMQVVPGRGAVPARSGREILALVPRMVDTASIVLDDFDRIPGPHWTPERMLDLARHLRSRLGEAPFDGAVVTHGTDTLEETAYLLDLVLDTELPVVLTGAMKTADDPSWDGPANLLAAARCAASERSRGLGVLVVFDDAVHAARGVTKMHTEAFGAFASPRHGSLGEMEVDGPRYRRVPASPERIPTDRVESRVALVAAAAGMDARPLRHALDDGARGVVVEALGRGNVPPAMMAGVREAAARGVPVVVASRCPRGRTAPRYGYEGGGRDLEEAGALFAGDLSAAKARIKLMVLLGAGREGEELRAAFST
jgi:L-asparaginase